MNVALSCPLVGGWDDVVWVCWILVGKFGADRNLAIIILLKNLFARAGEAFAFWLDIHLNKRY